MESMKSQWYMEVSELKLTRILPRVLAIEWQKYDLAHVDCDLEYHKQMAEFLQQRSEEGHEEMRRLKGEDEDQ